MAIRPSITFRKMPSYEEVTFEQSLNWKQQNEKSQNKDKTRKVIMKKLAGTTWGKTQMSSKFYTQEA
jgi:hypothetical protein